MSFVRSKFNLPSDLDSHTMCHVIIVYEVINMNIFLTKTHKAFINPLEPYIDYFYDGWMHFFGASKTI